MERSVASRVFVFYATAALYLPITSPSVSFLCASVYISQEKGRISLTVRFLKDFTPTAKSYRNLKTADFLNLFFFFRINDKKC